MRVIAAVVLLWPAGALAQTPPVDPAQVVRACALQTAASAGREADDPQVVAYCQCAIDLSAEVLTPAEFDMMGRYGLSQSQMGPPPSQAEMQAFDTPELEQRMAAMNARLASDCAPNMMPGAVKRRAS